MRRPRPHHSGTQAKQTEAPSPDEDGLPAKQYKPTLEMTAEEYLDFLDETRFTNTTPHGAQQ